MLCKEVFIKMKKNAEKAIVSGLIVVFVMSLVVGLLPYDLVQPVSAASSKKAPIHINNTAGGTLSYYQVNINITYDSDMNNNFTDIRVKNETAGAFVPYWIEDKVDGSYANIWFNATNIPASGWTNSTYFLYYGDAAAGSTSNGTNTFEFFDGFDDVGGEEGLQSISQTDLGWAGETAETDWVGMVTMEDYNGIWIVVYAYGGLHGAGNGKQYIRFSDDQGQNWSDENKLVNGTNVSGFPIEPHTGGSGASSAQLIVAPNGSLLIHIWEQDVGVEFKGIYQYRSTDNGASWTDEGRIVENDDLMFGADYVVVDNVIYTPFQISDPPSPPDYPAHTVLYKSLNNGTTWTFVSNVTNISDGTNEGAIEYIGNDTLLLIMRDDSSANTYRRESTDMGETWGALTTITSELAALGLEAGVLNCMRMRRFFDEPADRIYMYGRDRGSSPHEMVILISEDNGTTWSTMFKPNPGDDVERGDILKRNSTTYYMLMHDDGISGAAEIYEYLFERTEIAVLDTAKWIVVDADTYSVSNSEIHLSVDGSVKTQSNFSYGTAAKVKAVATEQDIEFVAYYNGFIYTDNFLQIINSDVLANDNFDAITQESKKDGSVSLATTDGLGDIRNSHTYEIRRLSDSVCYYQDDNLIDNETNTTCIPTGDLPILLSVWDSTQVSTMSVDWVLVRKYASSEPTAQLGTEQTAGEGGTYEITLLTGWNIIGWTDTTTRTAHYIGTDIGSNCTYITERNKTTGNYVNHNMAGPESEDNFVIERGWGYYAYLTAETVWNRTA